MTEKKHDITSSFLKIIEQPTTTINNEIHQKQLKIVGFPTGMGKTYGASNSTVELLEPSKRTLSIFVAPRIGILEDFKRDVQSNYQQKYGKKATIIQVKSDTELKAVEYYQMHEKSFDKIRNNIEKEFWASFQNSSFKNIKNEHDIDVLEINFGHTFKQRGKKKSQEEIICDTWYAIKQIILANIIWHRNKNDLQSPEILKLINENLENNFKAISKIFEYSYKIANQKIDFKNLMPNGEMRISSFNCIDESIVVDYFGLSFALNDIKNSKENDKYVIVITSQKIIRYINRVFEFSKDGVTPIVGNKENNKLVSTYINTFCKQQDLTPIYYIDEADEFYSVIVEFNTQEIILDNFLFRIKSFLDYSNISSLTSFINKIEKRVGKKQADELKSFIFSVDFRFDVETILDIYSVLLKNRVPLNPSYKLQSNDKKAIKQAIKLFENDYEIFNFLSKPGAKNNEEVFYLFLCYIDGIGAYDKIIKKYKDKENEKSTLHKIPQFLQELYITIRNYKNFLFQWVSLKNTQKPKLSHSMFFEYINRFQEILINSNYSETIIDNADFAELSDNSKFMFGNNSLSLVENQIKYLDLLIATDTPSDNISLFKKEARNSDVNENEIQLSFMYSFLTKVLISSLKSFTFPNEENSHSENDVDRSTTLDNELSNRRYLKAMKKAFNDIQNGNDAVFQVADDELIFDEDYIFKQSKNIINIFTCDYEENMKYGKNMTSSYLKMNNIHLKTSPEDELLNFYSTIKDGEVEKFSSSSVIYLMSATIGINSYFGNFDMEYIQEQLKQNNIAWEKTFTNFDDIKLTTSKNNEVLALDDIKTQIEVFDHEQYPQPTLFPFFNRVRDYISKNQIKNFNIYTDMKQIYKKYEFEAFIKSIEYLHKRKNINSLFFVSQTSRLIKTFLEEFTKNDNEYQQSTGIISKFKIKNGNQNKIMKNIYVIHKENYNIELKDENRETLIKHNIDTGNLEKDLIIIFYDSKFDISQKNNLQQNKKYLLISDNQEDDGDGTIADSPEVQELNKLNQEFLTLKEEIFNESKYKILLCSTFGSVAKGFNFVTNTGKIENGKLQEKDFDALNIAVDPYFDAIGFKADKDSALAYQRLVAMKDHIRRKKRPADLEGMNRHFYMNRHNLIKKEHLAHIARVITQTIGRIERRKFNLKLCRKQTIFINRETYNKMREFYQTYDYERYLPEFDVVQQQGKHEDIYRKIFSSNLSVNNFRLFEHIDKKRNNVIGDKNLYEKHKKNEIYKIKLLEEIVNFLLFNIRYNHKTIHQFKNIWDKLKDISILNNLPQYLILLDEVQNELYNLANIYCQRAEHHLLHKWVEDKNRIKLRDVFFTQFDKDVEVGFSEFEDNENEEFIDYITDGYHTNKSFYDLSLLVFQAEYDDFSFEVTEYIPILKEGINIKEAFKEKYTIGNTTFYPQKKVAFEFIKTAISEDTLKNVLNKFKIKFSETLGNNEFSYELYDLFLKHKNNLYTAIDVKFWSKSTEALKSKYIEEKDTKKQYVINLKNVKNRIYLNLFGLIDEGIEKNEILHKCLFVKNQIKGHKNYNKYSLNQNFIEYIQNEIKKG